MSKKYKRDNRDPIESLDDIGDPTYGVLPNTDGIYYRIRELVEYAKLKGVDTSELTEEEVAMFAHKISD